MRIVFGHSFHSTDSYAPFFEKAVKQKAKLKFLKAVSTVAKLIHFKHYKTVLEYQTIISPKLSYSLILYDVDLAIKLTSAN